MQCPTIAEKIKSLVMIVFQLKDITGFGSAAVDSFFESGRNELPYCLDLRVGVASNRC